MLSGICKLLDKVEILSSLSLISLKLLVLILRIGMRGDESLELEVYNLDLFKEYF